MGKTLTLVSGWCCYDGFCFRIEDVVKVVGRHNGDGQVLVDVSLRNTDGCCNIPLDDVEPLLAELDLTESEVTPEGGDTPGGERPTSFGGVADSSQKQF